MPNNSFKMQDAVRKKIFFILRSRLKWTMKDLRLIVYKQTGQKRVSGLTRPGGEAVLKALQKELAEQQKNKPRPSEDQLKKIYKLGYLLEWNTTRIRQENQKTNDKWDIKDCTPNEASKLILAMEAIIKWHQEKTEA